MTNKCFICNEKMTIYYACAWRCSNTVTYKISETKQSRHSHYVLFDTGEYIMRNPNYEIVFSKNRMYCYYFNSISWSEIKINEFKFDSFEQLINKINLYKTFL